MKYRTIVADPPWSYDSWPGAMSLGSAWKPGWIDHKRRRSIQYSTMTVGEIAALPVATLADPAGCHLYLWTTNRYLPEAFGVLRAWGFRYSQTLVWAKTPRGLGPGGTFANNAEFILFGRRGSLKHLRRVDSVWFNWHRGANYSHSQKPEHFLDLVEQVSPGPYVELFARRHRLQWDVWGNESANTATLGGPGVTLLARLTLVDFPRPDVARCLSPNASGKQSHWATKHKVRISVQERVWAEAKTQALPEMHRGLVVIRPVWTFPVARRRDGDNLTAILKSLVDSLVRGGWLLDDSSEHVRLEPPVIRVERGRRALVLEFETSGVQPTSGGSPANRVKDN